MLDGHNLLFRSFTSVPRTVTGKDDAPINGVYGLLSTILRLLRELGAESAIAAFDVPEVPTFRHELYPAYQGQRGPLGGEHAQDFARQIKIATEVLPTIGIQALTSPRYEADDIIGTLACQVSPAGQTAVVVSSDRDLLQLVREGVEVMAPANPPVIARTTSDVRQRLGIDPHQIPDYKAIAGDASDNIPGVQGVGAKTACSLINRYGDLDGIYEHLDELPTRTASLLTTQREQAYLFRTLTTLVTDLPLPLHLGDSPQLRLSGSARARVILEAAGY